MYNYDAGRREIGKCRRGLFTTEVPNIQGLARGKMIHLYPPVADGACEREGSKELRPALLLRGS